MNEISPQGIGVCILVCTGGCLTCISDGPVIIVDFVSGGTAFATGSSH